MSEKQIPDPVAWRGFIQLTSCGGHLNPQVWVNFSRIVTITRMFNEIYGAHSRLNFGGEYWGNFTESSEHIIALINAQASP